MKILLSIIVFVVNCRYCFAQQDIALPFIEDAVRSRKGVTKIVYLDSSITFFQPSLTFIKNGSHKGFNGQQEVKMKFTTKKVRHLDEEFKKKNSGGVEGYSIH